MTEPGLVDWPTTDPGYARSEVSAVIGSSDRDWVRATEDLLRWRVKTASGFSVETDQPVVCGDRVEVKVRVLGVTVVEPVEVVAVVDEPDRVGFAYRTLPGHPVSGEEAFILQCEAVGIRLIIRSLTRRAPQQPWRTLYPFLRVVQHLTHRRYLRALR